MNSYLEFNVHFWFLHLGKEEDFKKVEKMSDKMTKDEEQLPFLTSPFQFEDKMNGYDVYKILKAGVKMNVELILQACNMRTREDD